MLESAGFSGTGSLSPDLTMLGVLGQFDEQLVTILSWSGSMMFGAPGKFGVLLCSSDRIGTRTLGGTAC